MSATRREVLESLERLWDRYPSQRLGQLVTNLAVFADREWEEIYDLENDEVVEIIVKHLGPE